MVAAIIITYMLEGNRGVREKPMTIRGLLTDLPTLGQRGGQHEQTRAHMQGAVYKTLDHNCMARTNKLVSALNR